MASLLDWLGKRVQGAVAQINPWDDGETYDSVVNGAPKTPQQPQQPGQQQQQVQQPRFNTGVDAFNSPIPEAPKPKIDINANAELSQQKTKANLPMVADPEQQKREALNQIAKTGRPAPNQPQLSEGEVKTALMQKVQNEAGGNPYDRAINDIGAFAAGSNDKFLGAIPRGIANAANFVGGGFNANEAERRTNEFLRTTGQINEQGSSPLSQGYDRNSDAFKAGEAAGTGQRIATDIVTTAVPGAAVEKALRGLSLTQKGLQSANKAARVAGTVAPVVGGGLASSAVSQIKDPTQNASQNFGTGLAFDVATSALGPLGSSLSRWARNAPIPGKLGEQSLSSVPAPRMGGQAQIQKAVESMPSERSSANPLISSPRLLDSGTQSQMPLQTASTQDVISSQSLPTSLPDRTPNGQQPTIAMNVPYNPTSGQEATRGFAKRLAGDEMLPPDIRSAVAEAAGKYNVRNTQDLISRAGNLVEDNRELAERIANSGNNDVAQAVGIELLRKNQLDGNYEAAIDRIEDIARKATESGRATQILSAYGKLTPEGALRFTQRQINKFNDERGLAGTTKAAKLSPETAERITNVSRQIQSMPDGLDKDRLIVELTQLMNTAAPTPLLQKLTSIWRAGLLTSARTLEGGALGNTTKAILDAPSQAVAATIDRLVTAPLFNKGVRSNVFTLKGSATGAKEGLKQGGKYLKTGVDPRDAQQAYDTKGINWNTGNKAVNTVGKGSDYVYRALGAVDNPFYYSALGRANREEALIEASRRGLKGRNAKTFAADYVKNMSPTSKDAAVQTAKEAVFQNDTVLGNFATKIKSLPRTIKDPVKRDAVQAIVDFTIPFAKIPGAVATALVDYSPAGVVLKAVQAGLTKGMGKPTDLRALNAAIGKSTTGTIGSVWLGRELYNNGVLTLEEPMDEKERQLWTAEGKQKFSVKLGDRWYNMNYLQPLGGLLALGGGYERARKNGDPAPLLAATGTGLKSVTEQSFLQGVNDVVSLIEDPARNANSFVNSKVSSLIPNIVRDAARASDNVERETNSPLDAVRNSLPGLRGASLPQRDPYGAPVERRQSPAGVFFDPFKSTQAKSDAVTSEMRRLYNIDPKNLGVVPTRMDKNQSFGGTEVQLTPKQLDTLEKTAGPAAKDVLKQMIKDPRYKELSDEDKSKKLKNAIDASRAAARKQIASEDTFKNKKGESVEVNPDDIKIPNISLNSSKENKSYKEQYEDAQKSFNEDSKDWSVVEKAKKQKELNRLAVQKDFDNDTVDLYGMSKDDVYNLVSTDENGNKLVENILKYGDALVAAGLTKTNKFRDKYGNVKLASSSRSGSKKKGKGGGKKKSSGLNLASIRTDAFSSKVPTFKAPPKGSVSVVASPTLRKTTLKGYTPRIPTAPKTKVKKA